MEQVGRQLEITPTKTGRGSFSCPIASEGGERLTEKERTCSVKGISTLAGLELFAETTFEVR